MSDRAEIRYDHKGKVDEIVTYSGDGGCRFHLEYMADGVVWFAVYGENGQRIAVTLHSRGKIRCNVDETDMPVTETRPAETASRTRGKGE